MEITVKPTYTEWLLLLHGLDLVEAEVADSPSVHKTQLQLQQIREKLLTARKPTEQPVPNEFPGAWADRA